MPYDAATRQTPPVYIVMESNLLIAEDLCGALQASGPCRVVRISELADLSDLIEPEVTVSAAFLEMRYDQALEIGVNETFVLRGAKIILTVGEDDEDAVLNHGWAMLVRPFTEDMVYSALRSSVRET